MVRDEALPWTCERCGVPLSSILKCVALVSTLVFPPTIATGRIQEAKPARDLEKFEWVTQTQTETFTSLNLCMCLLLYFALFIKIFQKHWTPNEIVSVTDLLIVSLNHWQINGCVDEFPSQTELIWTSTVEPVANGVNPLTSEMLISSYCNVPPSYSPPAFAMAFISWTLLRWGGRFMSMLLMEVFCFGFLFLFYFEKCPL